MSPVHAWTCVTGTGEKLWWNEALTWMTLHCVSVCVCKMITKMKKSVVQRAKCVTVATITIEWIKSQLFFNFYYQFLIWSHYHKQKITKPFVARNLSFSHLQLNSFRHITMTYPSISNLTTTWRFLSSGLLSSRSRHVHDESSSSAADRASLLPHVVQPSAVGAAHPVSSGASR